MSEGAVAVSEGAVAVGAGAFRAVANPLAEPLPAVHDPSPAVLAFHRRLPGYRPTPLVTVPAIARRLGIASLLVKCESERFGLPAFKMLGASWATYRALRERLGEDPEPWKDTDELAGRLKGLLPFRLAAATDGNHGRAVARMAHLLGLDARIFVPRGTSAARIDAIRGEGAEVVVVPGSYDDAVARSAEEAGPRCAVISDTSWPGYTDVPGWVIEGYSTMFAEVDEALAAGGRRWPDVVVVQIGVGALAAAAVVHVQGRGDGAGAAAGDGRAGGAGGGVGGGVGERAGDGLTTAVIGVEPEDAACVTTSALAGELRALEGEQRSIMAGLNCGTPSLVAWPLVARGIAGFVTIGDEWARRAVRELASAGIEAGEAGAAGLAGLDALHDAGGGGEGPLAYLLGEDTDVLVLMTEGATDRVAWRRILGVEEVGTTE